MIGLHYGYGSLLFAKDEEQTLAKNRQAWPSIQHEITARKAKFTEIAQAES